MDKGPVLIYLQVLSHFDDIAEKYKYCFLSIQNFEYLTDRYLYFYYYFCSLCLECSNLTNPAI